MAYDLLNRKRFASFEVNFTDMAHIWKLFGLRPEHKLVFRRKFAIHKLVKLFWNLRISNLNSSRLIVSKIQLHSSLCNRDFYFSANNCRADNGSAYHSEIFILFSSIFRVFSQSFIVFVVQYFFHSCCEYGFVGVEVF